MTCGCGGGPCPGLKALERLAELEGQALSRPDRDRLTALLPAIVGALGSKSFLVRDLFEADAPGLALVLGSSSRKSIGRLLRRAAGMPVEGYVIERLGQENGAAIWKVVKVVS